MSRSCLYRRIAAAIGETEEAVERMREAERKELMVTLGLGENEVVYEQIAAATGESVDSVISMPEEERNQLIQASPQLSQLLCIVLLLLQVLGLSNKAQHVVQIEDDSDDEILVHPPEKENIYISEEEVEEVVEMEMPLAESSPRREYGGGGEGGGWGECPVCEQVRRFVETLILKSLSLS